MPCNLKDDPTLAADFIAKTGATSILFVENDAGTAAIEDALFNSAEVVPDDDNKITITTKAGFNSLTITINGAQNGDEVRLKEDCGGGVSELRRKFTFATDPMKRYLINAS
ncbi:MAG TPA: hypothetical protein VMH28_02140 [Candidatus Acidoferrales bacterium]|nr:hypothetical protein [Candidatus Acidoferrales bacterium]